MLAGANGSFQITGPILNSNVSWTNAFFDGVCTLEGTSQLRNGGVTWTPLKNFFTTNYAGSGSFSPLPGNAFYRLRAVDISFDTPLAFSNLVQSYGLLHTLAGNGVDSGLDNVSFWNPVFEGLSATNVTLSRPHIAMADPAGNIFIADKNSHSVLKITTDGRIHTVAGAHSAGNGPDIATPGTQVALNQPNGLWVRSDGTVYILDTGNGKVRRLAPGGTMTTLFTDAGGISIGRGLWVRDDEALVYYASQTKLRQWTAVMFHV